MSQTAQPRSPKEIVREGYDKVSHAYRADEFNLEGTGYQRFLGWLLPRLPDGARVLDLGCGNGVPVARALAEHCQVTGIDLSPVQIERARQLVPKAEFRVADMSTSGFPPDHFDAVVSFFAIIHVPVDEQAGLIGAIGAWLKPGGYLLASVGHKAWEGTLEDWRGVPGATMYWSHTDAATYKNWTRAAGLQILEEGFLPEGDGGHTVLLAQKAPA
jgi:SAM-dependent methyltransferase